MGLALTGVSNLSPQASAQACDPGGGTNARTVEFANLGATSVEVRWVNFQCGETLYTTLRGNASYQQQTFVSHLWRFYEVGTGRLLKEERISTQSRIEFGDPAGVVTSVANQTAPSPTAPAAAAAAPQPVFPGIGQERRRPGLGGCAPGGGNQSRNVAFRNKGTTTIEVWWVDFDCGERLYATLNPNAEYVQQTYATHLWRFYEAPSGPASQTLCHTVRPASPLCLHGGEPGGGSVLYKTEVIAGQSAIEITVPSALDSAWQPRVKATVSGTKVTFSWTVAANAPGRCFAIQAEAHKGSVAQAKNTACAPVLAGATQSAILTLDAGLIKRLRQGTKPLQYSASIALVIDDAHGGGTGLPGVAAG